MGRDNRQARGFSGDVLKTSCCTFYNTGITYSNLQILARVANIVKALYNWRLNIIRDELGDKPIWRVYISDAELSEEQIAQVKQRKGPVIILKRTIASLVK